MREREGNSALRIKLYLQFFYHYLLVIACPGERFGKDCKFKCLCKNDAKCNKVTGACSCRPGFLGDLCDESKFHVTT